MTNLFILFLQGCLIGFSIALPVGPIAMLCIRYTLIRGTLYGLTAGIGAAAADTLYGILGGLGVSIICDFLANYKIPCQLVGALFLCYMGISTLRSPEREKSEFESIPISYLKAFFTSFILTLTNPLTLVGFIGIYAALGIGFVDEKMISFLSVISGIFMGSICWWIILSITTGVIGRKLNLKSTLWLNRVSGFVFLGIGLLIGATAFHENSFGFLASKENP